MANKIAIIGGAGYIGSALSKKLAEDRHKVTVIDPNITPVHPQIFHVHREFEQTDIDLGQFDIVYHLAAITSIQKCEILPVSEVYKTNVALTRKIVNGLYKDTPLIYASTSAIYAGASKYSISKLQSEYEVAKHPRSTCLRLGTVYGISPNTREGILVNDMVRQAVTTGELSLWHGDTTRPYTHIDGCVDYLAGLTKRTPKKLENVFADFWSKEYIAKIIRSLTGCEINIVNRSEKFSQDFIVKGCDIVHKRWSLENDIAEIVRFYAERL
jgi:nucleoside-diphosphate-sugar epimerase